MLASYESAGERTRLLVRFHMVSTGISLLVTTEQVFSLPSGLSATLIQADVTGNGPSKAQERHGYTEFKGRSFALSRLDVQRGTAHAVWEVEGISTDDVQDIEVGVVIAYQSKPEYQMSGLGPVLVSGDLAPWSTSHLADSSSPIPRFAFWPSPPIELCSITD